MYKGDQLYKILLKYDFNLKREGLDVPTFLEMHYKNYLTDIENAASGNNPFLGDDFCTQLQKTLPVIKEICDKIVVIGRINRDGKIKDAYENAYSLFSTIEPYYLYRFSWAERDGMYYRIRRGDFRIKSISDSKKNKAELFHIKDDKRNLIGGYRFSIPGFPCLYLTSGFELGWFESGMPKQFSYCKMRIEESGEKALRLIDMSIRPVDLLSNIHVWILNAGENHEEVIKIHNYFLNYIITYPLAAACSLRVEDRDTKFVEEYVIPQMLLNWIRENSNIDGVRYKSSLNTTLVQGMGAVNIALPVKKFRYDGLCEYLASKISVSDIGYLDVNEEYKKYQQSLQELLEFKNNLWNKGIMGSYFCSYVYRLVEICEAVIVTYNSIMKGHQINELILHQIDCLADYIQTIFENRDCIADRSIDEAKRFDPSIDEIKLRIEAISDINEFRALMIKIIHKHAVFSFSKEDVSNFEFI